MYLITLRHRRFSLPFSFLFYLFAYVSICMYVCTYNTLLVQYQLVIVHMHNSTSTCTCIMYIARHRTCSPGKSLDHSYQMCRYCMYLLQSMVNPGISVPPRYY